MVVMEIWQGGLSSHIACILVVIHAKEFPGCWRTVIFYSVKLCGWHCRNQIFVTVAGKGLALSAVRVNYPRMQGKLSLHGFERETRRWFCLG